MYISKFFGTSLVSITSAASAVVTKKKGIGPIQIRIAPLVEFRPQTSKTDKTTFRISKEISNQ